MNYQLPGITCIKLTFVFLLSFSACRNGKAEKEQAGSREDSLKSTITGSWGDSEGNSGFSIQKDSIYVFSTKKSYHYKIQHNDMIVYNEGGSYTWSNIHSLKDTLFFRAAGTGNREIRAFRLR